MASAYSCHSLAFACTPPITSKSAAVVATLSSTPYTSRSSPHCDGVQRRLTGVPPPLGREHFQVPLKIADSYPKRKKHRPSVNTENFNIENMDKDGAIAESSSDNVLSMRNLISSYKEAVLTGVPENVYLTESAICSIEREKNQLEAKVVDLAAEVKSAKERIFRLNADFDNFRKNSEKERIRFTNNIQEEVIKSLLPMVDSFEKAKQNINPKTEKEKKIDASYRGIYKQFVETLRALGVSSVVTTGKKFDPLVHEAIARVGSQQFRDGIIIEEIRRGFLLKNQVLRQAAVKVSSGPGYKLPSTLVEEAAQKPTTTTNSRVSHDSDSGSS